MSGVSPTKLRREWSSGSLGCLTPKRLLDWVLLLRAAMRKDAQASWESIAETLQVDTDTLAHVAKRLVGLHLTEIDIESMRTLREAFVHAVVTPLGIQGIHAP